MLSRSAFWMREAREFESALKLAVGQLLDHESGWGGSAVDTGIPDETDSLRAILRQALAEREALEAHLRHALIFRALSPAMIDSYIDTLLKEAQP
jgi:hypothetical protein